MEKHLIASRIQTPDGTILWSRSVHDYVAYEDSKTGEIYVLDGGSDYQRTSINVVPAKDISVYSTAKWGTLRNFIIRNTILLDADLRPTGERGYVRLSSMSDAHLESLKTYLNAHEGDFKLYKYIIKEQKYRAKNSITIPEHDYTNELVQNIDVSNIKG